MSKLEQIIEYVSGRNPIHTKKLRKYLLPMDAEYHRRAENFLSRYERLLAADRRTLDFAVDCYLKMLADITQETVRFRQTGQYSSKSFAEVNARVYNNPAVMEYYMHALLLSQFLWKHHYEMFCFFNRELTQRRDSTQRYLEIGGGHGLQVAEAARILGAEASLSVVDISATSLELAQRLVDNPRVEFVLADVFDYRPQQRFDFITIGEVLEHLENPGALLRRAGELLADNGTLFITTPANAPTIDHIYLFRSADDIRRLLRGAGFEIGSEFSRYAEDVAKEVAEQYQITLHYGACLKKNP